LATIIGPTIEILRLASLVCGVWEWVQFNRIFVAKSRGNFLFDLGSELTLVSLRGRFRYRLAPPGGLRLRGTLSMRKSDRAGIFIAAFLLLSVVCMSAVKYGMSLRYAAFCEIPLCWLACSPAIAPQKAALPPWPWRQRRQALLATADAVLGKTNATSRNGA
jgi:hypothetical protein